MTTKVSKYMGGLGLDATNKLTLTANSTLVVGTGGTTAGNVNIGDAGQVAFGQATDLKIFHDGTDSQIVNTTGQFNLRGDDVRIENNAGDETGLKFVNGGAVEVYYDNSKHLETKQTGVGITGNAEISANVGIAGNVYIAKYMAIANTNPAATDALVVNGNIRIQSGQLIFADGSGQSAGSAVTTFPAGDYGLLDAANAATDSFGQVTAGLTLFDMLTSPTGSIGTEDLGALS